jgi:hypothetical protein
MAKSRPIGLVLQDVAAIGTMVLVVACSHDPVSPAPVYMNGAPTAAPAPIIAAPRPEIASPRRNLAAATASPVGRGLSAPRHELPLAVVAKSGPANAESGHQHRRGRHITKLSTVHPNTHAARKVTSVPRAGSRSPSESIPLDEPVTSSVEPIPAPTAAGSSEGGQAPWVSPPPAKPTPQFRPSKP